MKKLLFLLVIPLLISCTEQKEKCVPTPKHFTDEFVYLKPDSTIGLIKFNLTKVGKTDTMYFYGIVCGVGDTIRVVSDDDIFGVKHYNK